MLNKNYSQKQCLKNNWCPPRNCLLAGTDRWVTECDWVPDSASALRYGHNWWPALGLQIIYYSSRCNTRLGIGEQNFVWLLNSSSRLTIHWVLVVLNFLLSAHKTKTTTLWPVAIITAIFHFKCLPKPLVHFLQFPYSFSTVFIGCKKFQFLNTHCSVDH